MNGWSVIGWISRSDRRREFEEVALIHLDALSWTDGERAFMLVSTLDYEALFQCADRLLGDRLDRTQLPERG